MTNINAQDYINEKYPIDGVCKRDNDPKNKGRTRKGITSLDIRKGNLGKNFLGKGGKKNLTGPLKLEGFTDLRTLIISSHELTNLDISECKNLRELDCSNNDLNNLNINSCSKLEKINCFSNNYLEEVDISNCPKLAKIGFGFTRNSRQGKLVKVSQTSPAENSVRNILIIGITGNGKSALANILSDLSDVNEFGEGNASISVTKNFKKSDTFEWQGKKYRIIDNIGFGDTAEIAKEDILFKIGEGIYSVKEGINQVLFVFKGRFAPEHVKVFNLFKEFIAETGITKFTTLVRTNFDNFLSPEECEEDRKILLTQSPELVEIIDSCSNIIYVDNPPIPKIEEDDDEDMKEEKEEEASINREKREGSRKIVLNHLVKNCQEIYKLKKWDSIHQQVANCMTKVKEEEEKLESYSNDDIEKNRLQNEIKKNKGKIAEEVNTILTAEISAFPKLTAQIEMKNPKFWPFNKK